MKETRELIGATIRNIKFEAWAAKINYSDNKAYYGVDETWYRLGYSINNITREMKK